MIGKISYTYSGKYVGATDILYYNKDYPLTKEVFDAQWPDYLIPPDLVFTDTSQENQGESTVDESLTGEDAISVEGTLATKKSKVKPIIIGVCVSAIILVIGYYILFIEIPYRKRRKAYRRNHKRRMDMIRKRDDFI